MSVDTFNTFSAIGALLIGIFGLKVFFLSFFAPNHKITLFIKEKALLLIGIIVSGACLGSLVYSMGYNYSPCTLCWWQRIALFPMIPLAFIGFWKKESIVSVWTISILAIFGTIISLYHNSLNFGLSPLIPCSSAVSCTQNFVNEFGFVTIPLMSLCIFIAIIGLLVCKTSKNITQ
ncbi:MAG: disulfide bond formation protein B [bacterium]